MKRKNLNSRKVAVSFWGVCGSIASQGGHTACVALHYNRHWFVCDAGTGIRPLGLKLEKTKEPIAIFLSHLHWDHIFGLPFFKPLYQRGKKILLAGPSFKGQSFKKTFSQIMAPPFFPIRPNLWKANMRWLTLKEGKMKVGPASIESKKVAHNGKTFGFCFRFPSGQKIIYVTDHELSPSNKRFASWIKEADLLIHDSQYDLKKYRRRKGWGHSAFETVLEMAIQAKVKKYILFHHDPDASDAVLEKRLKQCHQRIKKLKSPLKCLLAKEGATLFV